MGQAFMVVLREGFEAFLIVAITLAYLRKTFQIELIHAVFWGIVASVAVSTGLGYLLWVNQGVHQPLWEGILGVATVVLVASLVVHMWRMGPQLKQAMESQLTNLTHAPSRRASFWGIFFFTLVMISREGMETVLLLFQIQTPAIVAGIFMGIAAAGALAYVWQKFSYLINLKHFFQVTAVFLLLFTVQIAVQAFHEFTEAGILPMSETLHVVSEPYSLEGIYGRWFSMATVVGCTLWLAGAWIYERLLPWVRKRSSAF